MKKFLLGRIGVANEQSSAGPTMHDCIEAVIPQADTLMRDVLNGLAVSAPETKARRSFGDPAPVSKAVADFLRGQAPSVTQTFAAHLRLGLYNPESQDFSEQVMVRFEDLELPDSQQIDASIEFALALQEVSRCVDDVRPTLDALVSSLMGWITVQPLLNPLKADVFVRALQASLKLHVGDEQVRAALILPAAGLLGVGLRQLYREICDWLRSQGVEPAAPLGTRLCGGGLGPEYGVNNSVTRTLVTLDKLRKLLSCELDSGVAGSSMQDFLHTVPASYVALEDMKLVEPLMKRLAQRTSVPTEVAASPVPVDLHIAREPTQGRRLGRQLGEEVVRMMLDKLMQDERLLPRVRQFIKELEPVLLDLARSDPRFFSERQHPARQFLDRLTQRSLAYTSEKDAGFLQFLLSMERAVQVLNGNDGDAALFEQVLRKLEDDWNRDEAVRRQQQEEAARALWYAQQRTLLAQRVAADFRARQENKEIPELVGKFLNGPWAQVVAQSQLHCTDGGGDPDGYLALVEDLIWSVQPRLARRDRARLVRLVPDLLAKLRQGLGSIDYPEERIPAIFDALVCVHEKVFEGPRLRSVAAPKDRTSREIDEKRIEPAPDSLLGASEFQQSWVTGDEFQESGFVAPGAEPAVAALQCNWSAADLKPGAWVELLVNGAWLRAQLTWVSRHRTLFMFISRGGLAHSMSRRTMERRRVQGAIRFVSDGHVVDNVLDAVAQTALENDLTQARQASGSSAMAA